MTTSRISGNCGIILLTITILSLSLPAYARYSGGTGEPHDPYQIATAEDIILLGESPEDYDKHFILTADIDLDPNLPDQKVFDRAVIADFSGVFDGNSYTISNLTIEGESNLGLFGILWYGADVKNLDLEAVDVNGTGYNVGGLVGRNYGSITTSYSIGIVSGDRSVGGLVGSNDGRVTVSFSEGTISGNYFIGGLVGENISDIGIIATSYSTATVFGESNVGGLVGKNSTGNISNCYSKGTVTGEMRVGGLAGENFGSGCISNCYSTGMVTGTTHNPFPPKRYVGGLVGCDSGGDVIHCFWDTQTSGQAESGGGTGKTTAEMQSAITFLTWGTCGNKGIWTLDEGVDYPRLWWQNMPGEPIAVGTTLSDMLTGAGTNDNPYLIYTSDELNLMGLFPCDWDKYFKLMADIDMSGFICDRALIAPDMDRNSSDFQGPPFAGVFDGNGYTISHLTIAGESYLGLFGRLSSEAEISNLTLETVNVNGTGDLVGALAGESYGSVTNCYSTGTVIANTDVGGLVGLNYGAVTHCYSTVKVSGDSSVGGLVGHNENSITTCCSRSSVVGDWGVGGLVGVNSYGTITASYSASAVAGLTYVGGLVGYNTHDVHGCHSTGIVCGDYGIGGLLGGNIDCTVSYSNSTCTVNAFGDFVGGLVGYNCNSHVVGCYSTGKVTGKNDADSVGGLVGENYYGIVSSCYSTSTVEGVWEVGGLVGWNEDAIVINSYSTGSITGKRFVGGLVGENEGFDQDSSVTNCYSAAVTTGGSNVGGLVGYNERATVTNSFWDIQASGCTSSDGGTGKTTAEMQTLSTFLDAGWDFVDEISNGIEDIWWIDEDFNYPKLLWERKDYIFRVEISTARIFGNPDDSTGEEYEFSFEVTTDESVQEIVVFTPSGGSFEIARMPEQMFDAPRERIETSWEYNPEIYAYEWNYEADFESPDALDAYGDGNYIILVHLDGDQWGQTIVWFGIPDTNGSIPQPLQKPVFTSFAHGAVLQSPVTIKWVPCTDPAANLVWIGLHSDAMEENYIFPVDITEFDEPLYLSPGYYEVGLGYGVWYQTQTPDGIEISCGKYSESDYEFTIVP